MQIAGIYFIVYAIAKRDKQSDLEKNKQMKPSCRIVIQKDIKT